MNRIPYFILALILLILDQLSKWAVTERLLRPAIEGAGEPMGLMAWLKAAPERLPYTEITILPFFNLNMVWNSGVSFGMFTQSSHTGAWVLIALAAAITLWFGAWLFVAQSRVQAIAIAMVISGAVGNMFDRMRFGAVIDFLDFHLFGWHYPAFNLADSCIVVGVLILIVYSLFFEKTKI